MLGGLPRAWPRSFSKTDEFGVVGQAPHRKVVWQNPFNPHYPCVSWVVYPNSSPKVLSLSSSTIFAWGFIEGYSEAGVWYLEPQGEHRHGVAKYLLVESLTPCILRISRYGVLPLQANCGSMPYLSFLGEPKVLPNHMDTGWIHQSR